MQFESHGGRKPIALKNAPQKLSSTQIYLRTPKLQSQEKKIESLKVRCRVAIKTRGNLGKKFIKVKMKPGVFNLIVEKCLNVYKSQ